MSCSLSRYLWLIALPALCTAAGCGDTHPSARSESPRFIALDGVTLQEPTGALVGQPTGFAVLPSGHLLIADAQAHAVYRYKGTGEFIQRIGQGGHGPTEFASGPTALVAGDSAFVVATPPLATAIDLRTGAEMWKRRIPGTAFPPSTPLAAEGDQFYFLYVDREQRTTLARATSAADALDLGGPFPAPMGTSHLIDDLFSHSAVAPLPGDSIAVVGEIADTLFIGPYRGPFESIPIAVTRRHGSRPDLLGQVRDDDPQSSAKVVYALSIPTALHRLSTGSYAYVVADLQQLGNHFGATLYLSIIDPGNRRTCPDAVLPGPVDPYPLVAFAGDTLVALNQVLTDSGAVTVARRYRISTEGCAWK